MAQLYPRAVEYGLVCSLATHQVMPQTMAEAAPASIPTHHTAKRMGTA